MVGRLWWSVIRRALHHLVARLIAEEAPGAEIAGALAMLFWAQGVRTGIRPKRDITPLAAWIVPPKVPAPRGRRTARGACLRASLIHNLGAVCMTRLLLLTVVAGLSFPALPLNNTH